MSIDITAEIDQRDLEDFVDRVIDGRDLIGEDGVLPIVDGLLDDFRVNSTCATARRFEEVVCQVMDAHPADIVVGLTAEEIGDMIVHEVKRALVRIGGLLAEEVDQVAYTLRSA